MHGSPRLRKILDRDREALNLINRLETNLFDLNKTDILNKEYKSLSKLSFPSRELELQVVKDQKEKSLLVRGIMADENATSLDTEKFEIPKNLDIRLHEGLRILKDWVNYISVVQVTQSQGSNSKNI